MLAVSGSGEHARIERKTHFHTQRGLLYAVVCVSLHKSLIVTSNPAELLSEGSH